MEHKHTNRLVHESSPYLQQHAHNPVDWYPWGDEALEKAKREDKPILVSIGYAACHWCHVMERESFENEETARLMNGSFVNIKIDREERPDIDHIYMDAVQAMTGSGGWPLNVFLTPDARPFYGGTYFPPSRAYNRSSWQEVLSAIKETYTQKKDEVEGQAQNLLEHLQKSNAFGMSTGQKGEDFIKQETIVGIAENLLKSADRKWGGFGKAPKFPQSSSIQYLLRHYHLTKNDAALQQALLSLDKMIYGGIYDQLGGGFARYSTDEEWLAPHFEKMLYDNALLIGVLAEAYQLTNNELYERTIKQTIAFTCREMMSDEGGFYSALDADSEGVEGKFYTWSKGEIERLLGDDATLFCEFYDVTESGNWEHTNILRIKQPLAEFAAKRGLNTDEVYTVLTKGSVTLMSERSSRVRPQLDDKVLLGWNCLMNISLCKAYSATGEVSFKEIALRNRGFIEKSFENKSGNGWLHTYKGGFAKYPAFLDDYAYLISSLIHLQEITGNHAFLDKAKEVTELVIDEFAEEGTGFFFFTSKNQQDVIIRKKEIYDAATPSGNSTMAWNLHYLGIVFGGTAWIEQSKLMVGQLGNTVSRYPTSFANWASLLQEIVVGVMEIAITGENALDILPGVLKKYIPIRVIQAANAPVETFPLLRGKEFGKLSLIYVCKDYSCQQPVRDISEINCC
jgi:uncharacterized protein YyaL (SSP411 family)